MKGTAEGQPFTIAGVNVFTMRDAFAMSLSRSDR
jgi:hypothetical protein